MKRQNSKDLKEMIKKISEICFIELFAERKHFDDYMTAEGKIPLDENLKEFTVYKNYIEYRDKVHIMLGTDLKIELKGSIKVKNHNIFKFEYEMYTPNKKSVRSIRSIMKKDVTDREVINKNITDFLNQKIDTKRKIKYDYEFFIIDSIPEWIINEIDVIHKEKKALISDDYLLTQLKKDLTTREKTKDDYELNQKGILCLLSSALNELYKKNDEHFESLSLNDRKKCYRLLKEFIIPIIGYDKLSDSELEEIVDDCYYSISQDIIEKKKVISHDRIHMY